MKDSIDDKGALAPFSFPLRTLRTRSEAKFSSLLTWFRAECTVTRDSESAEQQYAITLVAAMSHQGFALIQNVLSGNTFPSAMLARAMLETAKRFADVSQNGKRALAASLLEERGQLASLKKFQGEKVSTIDPSSEIHAIDHVLSTLSIEAKDAKTERLEKLLGREAEEYWKLLSRDVHSHPSILLRQFAVAVQLRNVNSVFERDQENLDAHFDIALYSISKFVDNFIEYALLSSEEERQRLRTSFPRHLREIESRIAR